MQLSLLHYTGAHKVVEERIRRYAKTAPWILVAWSGGKDSTAALLAAMRCCRGKLYAAYVHLVGQTHHVNAKTVLDVTKKLSMEIVYVDMCGRKFKHSLRLPKPPALIYIRSHGRSCRGFWEEAKQRGWPAPVERTSRKGKRWCCQVFKTEPLEALSRLGLRWHIVGVKRSDSRYRRQLLSGLDPALPIKQFESHTTLYPLLDLSDEDVWTLIRYYDITIYEIVKRQYETFGYSPNCVVCPLQSKRNFKRTVEQMPTAWLEKTKQVLLSLLLKHSCPDKKWTCRDLAWKLEALEEELERRTTTQHKE